MLRTTSVLMLDLGSRTGFAAQGFPVAEIPLDGVEVTLWASGAPPITGSVLEMSPRDLKVLAAGEAGLGSVVEVELRSRALDFSASLKGQVHWRQCQGADWTLGIFLNQALPHDMVGHFWSDLRKELRYPCEWPCSLYVRRLRRASAAVLLNYSRSGVLLSSNCPTTFGDEVTLIDPSQQDAAVVKGVVRWQAQPEPSQVVVGCEIPEEHGLRVAAYLRSIGRTSLTFCRRPQ